LDRAKKPGIIYVSTTERIETMETNHTPGPWAVKYHEDTDTYSIYVAGRQWDSWTVAALGHSKEDEANARLIAAAPAMLKALYRITHPAADESDLEFALQIIDQATEKVC
jgi:hypothetical protein